MGLFVVSFDIHGRSFGKGSGLGIDLALHFIFPALELLPASCFFLDAIDVITSFVYVERRPIGFKSLLIIREGQLLL